MNEYLSDFEDFCETDGIVSGKALSYRKALQYLMDFLNITSIDQSSIQRLLDLQLPLQDRDSPEYECLYAYLLNNNRSSYLAKGFINASLNYFRQFIDN